MNSQLPEFHPRVGADSADATRIAPVTSALTINVDETRVVHPTTAYSDLTRIAPDVPDHNAEGTRFIHRIPPSQLGLATEHAVVERYSIGDIIGDRYEVLAIHRGTMGVVYGTFDHTEKLPRALKTFQQCHASDSTMRDMFTEEALTWVRLEKHPFIVRAYWVQHFDGDPYVITEYVRGQENMGGDLRAWLGHPKLTLQIAVEMALQIAQGMQHAVRKVPGLLHRDLKPANILVDSQARAMVTDFGLAHAENVGAGTPAYMAPEQWRAKSIDVRTDIYAYGCILYEMFTGYRMYPAQSEHEWEAAHLSQMAVAPRVLNPRLPTQITAFIARCIAKQHTQRPANWDEVVLECARWFHEITGLPVVFDFSSATLTASELDNAGYSFGVLGNLEEALGAFKKAIAIDQNYANAWSNMGGALKKLKRYEEALAAYNKTLALNPHNGNAWALKASTLEALKRYKDAINAYEWALSINPSDSVAWRGKGNVLEELKRYEDALAAYDQALALAPTDAFNWSCKGNVLEELRRYEEALAAYDQALALAPTDAFYWSRKGNVLEELKRYEDALAAYDQALALAPTDAFNWSCKGNVLEELRRYEEALAAYDQALALAPTDAFNWRRKGNVLEELRRYEEALAAYDQALALAPTDAFNWRRKGNVLEELKRYEEALAAYDQLLAIDPNYTGALRLKGNMLYYLKRYEDALSAFDFALTINHDCVNTWMGRGHTLYYLKRYTEAISAYDRVAVLDVANNKNASKYKMLALNELNHIAESRRHPRNQA